MVDSGIEICRRIRAAKARKTDVVWWYKQLDQAKGARIATKIFILACFLNFCEQSSIVGLADLVSTCLEDMKDDEWSAVVDGRMTRVIRGREKAAPELLDMVDAWHPRFAYFLTQRLRDAFSRKVFLKHFLKNPDKMFAEYRQELAVECALANELDWGAALAVVRETYAQGAAHAINRGPRPLALPESVASEILSNPSCYPVILWDAAEYAATVRARRVVRAVGKVAAEDDWFED